MFQLVGIAHEPFAPLFELSDAELARRGIVRCVADSGFGYPCRVSLEDATVGDELLLLNHAHHDVDSPYRATGPIFVRRGQRQRALEPGAIPPYVTRRLISLRVYDTGHMMLSADVVDGGAVRDALMRLFGDPSAAYVHLHNAKPGCFSCLARRCIVR
jgi:hypothetical protein